MDLSKLTTGDKVIVGVSGIALLVFSFFSTGSRARSRSARSTCPRGTKSAWGVTLCDPRRGRRPRCVTALHAPRRRCGVGPPGRPHQHADGADPRHRHVRGDPSSWCCSRSSPRRASPTIVGSTPAAKIGAFLGRSSPRRGVLAGAVLTAQGAARPTRLRSAPTGAAGRLSPPIHVRRVRTDPCIRAVIRDGLTARDVRSLVGSRPRRRMARMDLKKLTPGEIGHRRRRDRAAHLQLLQVVRRRRRNVGGGVDHRRGFSRNGWQAPSAFLSVVAILIGIVMAALRDLHEARGRRSCPSGSASIGWGVILIAGGVIAFVFVLIKWISNTDATKIGIYLGLIATAGTRDRRVPRGQERRPERPRRRRSARRLDTASRPPDRDTALRATPAFGRGSLRVTGLTQGRSPTAATIWGET